MRSGETLFNCYQLVKLLGEGGTSKVYLARNTKVGQLVAVKIIDKRKGGNAWLAEKDLLIELRHPSIPVIIDIGEDEDYFYLVEEFVEGTLLSDYKGKLQEAQALEMMHQLCGVLSYLHTSLPIPIIYMDLKPNNIIIMNNGHLKLIDFGIAKKHDGSLTQETGYYGTKGFAAPELFGLGEVDHRTDIYSMGVMFYYLLTGISLVEDPSGKPAGRMISNTLDAMLKKMASPLSDRRYNTIEEVAEEVKALKEGRRKHEDLEKLIEAVPNTVIVLGMGRRVGTTHTAIQIAASAKSLGMRSVILETHPEGSLADLASSDIGKQVNRQSLASHGISIYPYQKTMPVQALLEEKPDLLVIDGGDMKTWNTQNKKAAMVAVTTVQDWEMSRVESYLTDYPPNHISYGLNMVTEERGDYFTNALPDLRFLRIPYTNEPFAPDDEVVSWIKERLTGEKEVTGNGTGHRGFKIKNFMASLVASK